jgi:hypothetical protein
MDYWWRVYLTWLQLFFVYEEAKELEAVDKRCNTLSYRIDKIERALMSNGLL